MMILNYTGKNVRLYEEAEYLHDRGVYIEGEYGKPYIEFPSRGCLEARSEAPRYGSPSSLNCNGISIPIQIYPKWVDVDALPVGDEDTFALIIVNEEYVWACEYLGIPTDKLLTVGKSVVDEENWSTVIGYVGLVWHTFEAELETEKNSDQPAVTIRNLTSDDVVIYKDVEYDTEIKKYRGGVKISVFTTEEELPMKLEMGSPDSVVNGYIPTEDNPIPIAVPLIVPTTYKGIKALDGTNWEPNLLADENEYFIVTEDIIRECYRRGISTGHLLTVGDPVVDRDGYTVIGYTHLVHH